MVRTDGRPTIANGAGDHSVKVKPRIDWDQSWKVIELQAEQASLIAQLERVGNEIALVKWADGQVS